MSSSGGHPETPEKSPIGDPGSSQAIGTASPTLSDINTPATPVKGQMQSPSGSWQGSTPRTPGSANSRRRRRRRREREGTINSRHSPGYLLPESNLGDELARAFGSDDGSDDEDVDVAKEEVEVKAEIKEEMKADTPTSDDIYTASPLASSQAKESAAEAGSVGKGGGGEKELEEEEPPIYAEDDMKPVSPIKSPGPQNSLSEVSKPNDSKLEAEVESNDNDDDGKTEEQQAEDKARDKEESQPSPQMKPDTDITPTPRSAASKDSTREEETDDKTGSDTVKPDSPAFGHNNAPTSPATIPSTAKDSTSSTSSLTPVTGRASLPSQQKASEAATSNTPTSASQPQQKKRPAAPPPRASYALNTTMEQARTEAKNMLRPLLERIEHERLWTNGDSLRDIRLRMQEDIKTLDMEQAEKYATKFVRKFVLSLEAGDMASEFMKEWQHVVVPVMNQLWNGTLHKAKEVALSYIRYLINNVYSTCVDFNECMVGVRNRLPASTRADSMLSSPRRMPGPSRRQSQDSVSSEPESVLNPRDRRQLSKARPEQLVDRILLQIQQLDDANNQIYQHEQIMGEMQKKIDELMAEVQHEQVELRLAQKRHVRELEEVQKEADIRVESAVKSPAARIIRPRESAKTQESDENAMLPLPDPSAVAAIMSPQAIEQARFASRQLEQQETASRNRYYEQIQSIMVMIHEEGDLTKSYVEKIGHRVAYGVQSRSESDWIRQLGGEASNPSSSVSDSTKDQLSTRLRIAIEERDALRQERDKYREEATNPHTIEHLESAERKRILQMAQRALKVVDENVDNLVQGSQHVAEFALVAVEVGRPEAGQQACAKELRAVLDLSEKLKSSRPEHYNSGIIDVGGLSMLDTYQDFWLPQTEDFASLSGEFIRALVSLGRKAQAYYAATSQDPPNENQSKRSPPSRAAAFFDWFRVGGKGQAPTTLPFENPEWLQLHQNGPCDGCKPVVSFPAGSVADGADPGSCVCGSEQQARVSFENDDAPTTTTDHQAQRKSILERKSKAVGLVDTILANTGRREAERGVPGTPYPPRVQSVEMRPISPTQEISSIHSAPIIASKESRNGDSVTGEDFNVAKPSVSSQEDVSGQKGIGSIPKSAIAVRKGCSGCQCRCSRDGEQNILVSKDGSRIAFFICGKMTSQRLPLSAASSPAQSEGKASASAALPLESPLSNSPSSRGPLTRILSGEGLFFESPEQNSPESVRNTAESSDGVQRSPGDRQLSNTSASAPEITSATIQTSPVRVHPRNLPTASLFETLGHAMPRRHSSGATRRRERAERKSSVQSTPDAQLLGTNDHASNAGEGDGSSEDWHPVEQHGDNEDASEAYSIRREAQPGPSPWSGSSSSRHSTNDQIPQHPAPTDLRAQVQQFIWWLVRFLTIAQLYNALTILQFVGLLGWYILYLPLLERCYLRRGLTQRKVLSMPREEMISLAMWCLVVLHFMGLLAIHEERRVWLAANARTASYIRGLQHRSPYPLWPLYEVDYRLVIPAWKSLILRLHDVYFRPVLDFLLGGQ